MILKSNKKLLISMLTLSLLCGLNMNNVISNNNMINHSIYAESVNTKVNSIKEAILKLASSRNYTIKVSTKTGPLDIQNNMFYTEDAFYDDYLGDEYGYCKVKEGVFRFDRYARKFTPSKILLKEDNKGYDSIWGNGFFYGFSDLDLSEFENANAKEFDCTKKKNKLTFMKMFSIDQSKYPDVNAIHLKVDDDVNTLTFSVSLKDGEEHRCSIENYNITKIDYLDKQLASGKTYYSPDATMVKIKNLFDSMNYTHLLYDYDYDENKPVGYEKFTEEYFISGYDQDYLKENSASIVKCSGMVGFENYKVNDNVTLNGSYWTYLYNDSFSMITSFPYNEDPYVPNVYTYPTFLKALEESQYFESAGVEGSYYTNKISLIADFCNNFQLWEALEANSFTPCGLFMEYSKDYNNQDTVTFKIEYDYYGLLGTTDFVFSDFGKTSEPRLNKEYVKKYVNAYYNGSKVYVEVEGFEEMKKLSIHNNTNWLQDSNIVEAYEYVYYRNAEAGSKINLKIKVGEEYQNIIATPEDSPLNDNYINDDGVYKIKETANTSIYVFKLKDGSWKFRVSKVN